MENFRTLLDKVCHRGTGKRPYSRGVIADRIGLSRQHLYTLQKTGRASKWVIERISQGTKLPLDRIARALKQTMKEAEILE